MPAKLSEAFRLSITGSGREFPSWDQWQYTGAGPVGSNANRGAGPMNYQPMPPMVGATGPGPHVPATGYYPARGGEESTSFWPQNSSEMSNTLLFIAIGVFFLFLLDMAAKR